MKYDEFKAYFELYVKQYRPYLNNNFYQIFINFLETTFFNDIYTEIPTEFKQLYEDNEIPVSLFDTILRSFGFEQEFVESISSYHKALVLYYFSNYYKDKGTVSQLQAICDSFAEPINIYELYTDIRDVNGVYNWYFFPKPIYTYYDITLHPLSYDSIYYTTPEYLISKQYLHNLHKSGNISLPIKSNILQITLLNKIENFDYSSAIMATVFNHFKNYTVSTIVFNVSSEISFIGLYQLWHYLLSRLVGKIITNPHNLKVLVYDFNVSDFPYYLDPAAPTAGAYIQDLVDEYNAISSHEDSLAFQNNINSLFLVNGLVHTTEFETFSNALTNYVDETVVRSIDNRLDDSDTPLDILPILYDIQSSIYQYIGTSTDPLLIEYKQYLLEAFSMALISPSSTTTYKLLDFLKPFHTLISTSQQNYLLYKSKLNDIYVEEDFTTFKIRYPEYDACTVTDDIRFSERVEDISYTFTFSATNYVQTNSQAISKFSVGDFIYSDSISEIDNAVEITSIDTSNNRLYLDAAYVGYYGTYDYAYKRFKETEIP